MFKKFLIPHSQNEFKPHVFREISIVIILTLAALVFVIFTFVLPNINKSGLMGAIYSSVLVDSTNIDRKNVAKLDALTVNPLLVEAAQAKANDMASKGYFAHNSPEGLTPWYWIKGAGYNYLYAGENLAIDFEDSDDVERAWMNSPGHRANILNVHFTEVGIATAVGEIDGRKTTFVVQMFGSPRTTPTPVVAQVTPPIEVATIYNTPTVPTTTESEVKPLIVKEVDEIVSTSSSFVAVKRVAGEADVFATPTALVLYGDSKYESNWFQRVIVNPSNTLKTIYLILSILIFICLVLFIYIEKQVQHPKNIGYAILILIIILIFFSLHWLITFSGLAVT